MRDSYEENEENGEAEEFTDVSGDKKDGDKKRMKDDEKQCINDLKEKEKKKRKKDKIKESSNKYKMRLGKRVLYIAMCAMGAAVVVDLCVQRDTNPDTTMLNNAFEAFKLITMTVLGYIFGTNHSANK